MPAYYNEIDAYAAQWLRNLISAGHIAPGDVDERSIEEVSADDLTGYDQCHFFAGIGGWSYALRLAGWRDDRPVWTGSCPCQPLSSAGQQQGPADARHLWPAFFRLIAECGPPVVFGEQVASNLGREWLAGVRLDLEHLGYACGAADLPAAYVGAPHIRQRLWWVGIYNSEGRDKGESASSIDRLWSAARPSGTSGMAHAGRVGQGPRDESAKPEPDGDRFAVLGGNGELADPEYNGRKQSSEKVCAGESVSPRAGNEGLGHSQGRDQCGPRQRGASCGREESDRGSGAGGELANSVSNRRSGRGAEGEDGAAAGNDGGMGDPEGNGCGQERKECPGGEERSGTERREQRPWDDCRFIPCADGKARPAPKPESGIFPLADGIPGRVGRLRAYGNAIVPQVAAAFIQAYVTACSNQSVGEDIQ